MKSPRPVLILGKGKTGDSFVNYFLKKNKPFVTYDTRVKKKDLRLKENLKFNLTLKNEIDFRNISFVACSPGFDLNDEIIKEANKRNIKIKSDIEIFVKENASRKILITGTNGKSSVCYWLEISQGSKLVLSMRGGYRIEADLSTSLASVPGLKDAVPFAFHRNVHDEKSGKMMKLPAQGKKDAGFHLVQTNLPYFMSGTPYEVPKGGLEINRIASQFGIPLGLLAQATGMNPHETVEGGVKLQIPSKGYGLRQAWFFMDQEIFDSILVKGFLREELPTETFEKIYSSPWGKVYKIIQ